MGVEVNRVEKIFLLSDMCVYLIMMYDVKGGGGSWEK